MWTSFLLDVRRKKERGGKSCINASAIYCHYILEEEEEESSCGNTSCKRMQRKEEEPVIISLLLPSPRRQRRRVLYSEERCLFLRFVQSLLVEFQNWRPTALRLSSCVCVGPSEMNAQREGIFLLLCTTLVIPAVCPSSSKSTVTNTKRKKKSCLRLKKRKG